MGLWARKSGSGAAERQVRMLINETRVNLLFVGVSCHGVPDVRAIRRGAIALPERETETALRYLQVKVTSGWVFVQRQLRVVIERHALWILSNNGESVATAPPHFDEGLLGDVDDVILVYRQRAERRIGSGQRSDWGERAAGTA